MTDTERLDWLEKQGCYSLISDDGGRWACTCDGKRSAPGADPTDVVTYFFIKRTEWKDTIREAIDGLIDELEEGDK